jgi:hypothetical protein
MDISDLKFGTENVYIPPFENGIHEFLVQKEKKLNFR